MPRSLLLTGGTGFIGANLIKLLKDDYQVINVGRNESPNCENIFWDLSSKLELNIKPDMVIHCASIVGNNSVPDKTSYIDINVKSTLHLLEYCKAMNIKKFIYLSTGGVYGYNNDICKENSICNPIDIYSMSKYFSEMLFKLYESDISITVLRLFFPYGKGQNGRLISNLIYNITKSNSIYLNKNGLPIVNPIHIIDVIEIIKKVIETDISGTFNVCGNELISIEDLCIKIAQHVGIKNVKVVYHDRNVANLIGDNSKICSILNYQPKIDLDYGIRLSI